MVQDEFGVSPALRAGALSLAVVVTTDRRRGAEVHGARLARALSARGHEVEFLCLRASGADATVPAVPVGGDALFQTVRRLRAAIRGKESVLANGSATLKATVMATAGPGSWPGIVYGSIGEPSYWASTPARRFRMRLLLDRVDMIAAVSQETRRQLLADIGVPADRVEVVPTGVPSEMFVPHGPPSGAPNVIWIGSLSPEKDPASALTAFARAGLDHAVLRIVGDGPLRGRLARLIGEQGLGDRVEMAGASNDIRPHLAWADLLLLTSRTEGLPGVVMEAGAAGVPTVGFDVGGTRELLDQPVTGELVPPGDVDALAAVLAKWASRGPELGPAGRAAADFVRAHYPFDASVEGHEALLRRVARRR